MASLWHSLLFSKREWIKRIIERTQRSFTGHGGKKHIQDLFLILFTELSMYSLNLERPLRVILNNQRTLISPIFQAQMYSIFKFISLIDKEKMGYSPFQMSLFHFFSYNDLFSIHRSTENFCLSPPYYQLLDKRDLFPWEWKRAMHTKEALKHQGIL